MATTGLCSTATGRLDGAGSLGGARFKDSRTQHYDESIPSFYPYPTGPFEHEPEVHDKESAHAHFVSTQEIKLKDRMGLPMPVTSYVEHYPKHPLDASGASEPHEVHNLPFSGDTEYMREFVPKACQPRPTSGAESSALTRTPFMGKTSYSHFHTGFPVDPKPARALFEAPLNDVDTPSFTNDTHTTTNQLAYVPHPVARFPGPQHGVARAPMPWLAGPTTNQEEYPSKDLPLLALVPRDAIDTALFDAATEYQDEYLPKEGRPFLPHMTGLANQDGILLPGPRKSLGVQYWHRGDPTQNYILIPCTVPAPCSGWQVFTTVHDNEETATILIHYGEGGTTANTEVLGQLDLTGIPPAPRDVPRILVKFSLSSELRLHVEVRDLDTQRQKEWLQRGGIVLVREGNATLGPATKLTTS